jgi:P27 family predicted phage terminase small subunit
MRGRKPKPTILKELAGNPGHRPLNAAEPQPAGLLAEPPDWFNADQRTSWDYALAHAPAGLLRKIDRSVLAIWVVAEDLHRRATLEVLRGGMLVKSKEGEDGVAVQSPYLPIVNRQAGIMLKCAEQLGFSPAARPRLHVPPTPLHDRRAPAGAGDAGAETFAAFLAEDPETPTAH